MLIDPMAFKEMKGKYVFSRVKIKNADSLDIYEVGVFFEKDSPYTIYVYRIND